MDDLSRVSAELCEMDFEALRDVDVRTVDPDTLVDIRDLHIDTSLPKEERIREFLRQVKNPYCFRVGKVAVSVSFSNDGVTFEQRTDTRTAPGETAVSPLAGLIVCGDCGRNMVRKNNASTENPYIYYVCAGSKQKSGCKSHSIRDLWLEQAVRKTVQAYISAVLDLEQTLGAIRHLPFTAGEVKKTEERLLAKRAEVEKYRQYQMKLHENFSDGVISREDYIAFGERYDVKICQAEAAIHSLEQDQTTPELTRKLAVELIDRIFVYENQRVGIVFQFQYLPQNPFTQDFVE